MFRRQLGCNIWVWRKTFSSEERWTRLNTTKLSTRVLSELTLIHWYSVTHSIQFLVILNSIKMFVFVEKEKVVVYILFKSNEILISINKIIPGCSRWNWNWGKRDQLIRRPETGWLTHIWFENINWISKHTDLLENCQFKSTSMIKIGKSLNKWQVLIV